MKKQFHLVFLLMNASAVLGFLGPSSISRMASSSSLTTPPPRTFPTSNPFTSIHNNNNNDALSPTYIQKQRRSVGIVQMQGLFGLGFAEIAVILVVVGFVLGPQNIGKLVRSSADRASAMKDELERVPDEFKKGLEEGESTSRARNARVVKIVKDKEDETTSD